VLAEERELTMYEHSDPAIILAIISWATFGPILTVGALSAYRSHRAKQRRVRRWDGKL